MTTTYEQREKWLEAKIASVNIYRRMLKNISALRKMSDTELKEALRIEQNPIMITRRIVSGTKGTTEWTNKEQNQAMCIGIDYFRDEDVIRMQDGIEVIYHGYPMRGNFNTTLGMNYVNKEEFEKNVLHTLEMTRKGGYYNDADRPRIITMLEGMLAEHRATPYREEQ